MSLWPRLALLLLVCVNVTLFSPSVGAETICRWSQGFHLNDFDDDVLASAIFDDGSGPVMVVGGRFEAVNGQVVNHVARWDGSAWQALGNGLPGAVFALQVYDDGSGEALYAGGYFRSVGESSAGYLAKWNGLTWSPVGGGLNGGVNALAVYQEGGEEVLVAGGRFSEAGGVSAQRLARWDGQVWASLGGGFGPSDYINSMVPWLGSLVVGGRFRYLNGQEVNHIAGYSGNGQWRPMSLGTSSTVNRVEVFDSGSGPEVYAAGDFSQAGGSTVHHVAKWNLISWEALGSGVDAPIHALKTLDLGEGPRLYAGGRFTEVDGQPADYLASWDGTGWQPVASNLRATPRLLFDYDPGTGPTLFAGGSFSLPGGVENFAAWDGERWNAWGRPQRPGSGLNGEVRASTVFDDGSGPAFYAAGDFSVDGDDSTAGLAKWQGSRWTALSTVAAPSLVTAVVGFDDGNGPALYVAGTQESSGSPSVEGVAKWDGQAWVPLGAGLDGSVYALEVFDDGNGPALYVGGSFTVLDGSGAEDAAKWDGSTWTALGTGADAAILDFAVFDDGQGAGLFAAGHFEEIDGVSAVHIARWDGLSWNPLPSGEFNGSIYTLEVFDEGGGPALYAGGSFYFDFTTLLPMGRVARWDGSEWTDLDLSSSIVTSEKVVDLAVFDDGRGPSLYATGQFQRAGTELVNHITRWNGSGWEALGTGLEARVEGFVEGHTLSVYDDGVAPSLFVGGDMSLADGRAAAHIGRFSCFEPASLVLELPETAEVGERLTTTVELDHGGRSLAAASFTLDYDETCLDPDLNGDGELDELQLPVNETHGTTVIFDAAASNGEIRFTANDPDLPVTPLPQGALLGLGFEVICDFVSEDFIEAEIRFADESAPTFLTDVGEVVGGRADGDSVLVWADWLIFADGFESGALHGFEPGTPR